MRLFFFAVLVGAAAFAEPVSGYDPSRWVQGRLLLTGGASFRAQEQVVDGVTARVNEKFSNPAAATQLQLSAAFFARRWFGVAVDLRHDVVGITGPSTDRLNQTLFAGSALATFRWQPSLLIAFEAQGGWFSARRPLICNLAGTRPGRGGCYPNATAGTFEGGFASNGPMAGAAITFEPQSWLTAQVYGRAGLEFGSAFDAALAGPHLSVGLNARVGALVVGPFEAGLGLNAELEVSGLSNSDVNPTASTGLGSVRFGAGLSVQWRRDASPSTTGPDRQPVTPTVRGRVLRVDGTPVASALISLGTTMLTSDASGRFEASGLPEGPATLKVSAPGLRPSTRQLEVASGPPLQVEVVLETPTGPGRLTGVVRASPEKVLPGAKVLVQASVVTTDASGAFTIDKAGPGPVKVAVTLSGYADGDEVVQVPAEGTATLEVTLEPVAQRSKAKLRGVISSASGPVAKAVVRVTQLKLKQAVKADGRFELEVPGGVYTLVIEAPKHVTQTRTVEVLDGDQAIFQIELEKTR